MFGRGLPNDGRNPRLFAHILPGNVLRCVGIGKWNEWFFVKYYRNAPPYR